jgi:hypothetical protein
METKANLVPTLVGLNVTMIVHLSPTGTLLQSFDCENESASVPPRDTLEILSDFVPVL